MESKNTAQADTPTITSEASVSWLPFDAHSDDDKRAEAPSRALLDAELYRARSQRTGNRYPGQRNYHGFHWFSNSGDYVWTESLFERRALLWLDFTMDIVAIASQPMLMTFADGTRHFPDFVALHSDHRQVVYNVKPLKYVNDKVTTQFTNATELCQAIGWEHQVISAFDPVVLSNLEWLSNFRQHCFAPSADAREQLLETLTTPRPLHAAAASMTHTTWNATMPAMYHLAWTGEVQLDLTIPLSNNSLVEKAHHAHA